MTPVMVIAKTFLDAVHYLESSHKGTSKAALRFITHGDQFRGLRGLDVYLLRSGWARKDIELILSAAKHSGVNVVEV